MFDEPADPFDEPADRSPTLTCPHCGSTDVARIQYGLPALSDDLEADLAAGRVVLGGCLMESGGVDHACNACGVEFWENGPPVPPEEDDE